MRPKYLQFLLQLSCSQLCYQQTIHSKDDSLCHPLSFESCRRYRLQKTKTHKYKYTNPNHSKDDTLCQPLSFESCTHQQIQIFTRCLIISGNSIAHIISGFSRRLVFATIPSLRRQPHLIECQSGLQNDFVVKVCRNNFCDINNVWQTLHTLHKLNINFTHKKTNKLNIN